MCAGRLAVSSTTFNEAPAFLPEKMRSKAANIHPETACFNEAPASLPGKMNRVDALLPPDLVLQ